jgi:hypothetical protein
MAERCNSCKTKGGHGAIGMVVLCRSCLAAIIGWSDTDPRLKKPIRINLNTGESLQWLPWSFHNQDRTQ